MSAHLRKKISPLATVDIRRYCVMRTVPSLSNCWILAGREGAIVDADVVELCLRWERSVSISTDGVWDHVVIRTKRL